MIRAGGCRDRPPQCTIKAVSAYLNKYVFRLNRRGNQQAAFQRAVGTATSVRCPEIDQLYVELGSRAAATTRPADVPGGWSDVNRA